jgi:hypothetical protein
MIDPVKRWAPCGEKPALASLLTFASLANGEGPEELVGADAVIVGAPMDELTFGRPGTLCRPTRHPGSGPHLEAGVDALRRKLRVIDFGDAPMLPPADVGRTALALF